LGSLYYEKESNNYKLLCVTNGDFESFFIEVI